MSEPKIFIPKFGSFRPKPAPPVADQVEGKDKSRAKSDQHDQDDGRSRHERHRSHRSHSKDRRGDGSKGQHDRHYQLVERKDSPPPSNSRSVDTFVIDRKGDEDLGENVSLSHLKHPSMLGDSVLAAQSLW